MITLKEFNALPDSKRLKVAKTVFYNMPDWYIDKMSKEWHHNLDAEHKLLLSSIYKRTDNKSTYYTVRVDTVL